MGILGSPNVENLKNRKNVGGLIKALDFQKDTGIRYSAAIALGEIGDRQAIDPLMVALKDPDDNVRAGATWALCQIPDERAVEALVAALQDSAPVVRQNAASALKTIGDRRAIGPLIASLSDDFEGVRANACLALGDMPDEQTVDLLIGMITDRHHDVRRTAAISLGTIGDRRALDPLIEALQDPHAAARTGASYALIAIPDEKAVEPLLACLHDSAEGVRQNAAYALKSIGDERAVGPLIVALNDNAAQVRVNAAIALGQISDTRAITPLAVTAVKDPVEAIRKAAGKALGSQCSGQEMGELVAELDPLENFTPPTQEQVYTALADGETGELALTLLGAVQGGEVVKSIISIFFKNLYRTHTAVKLRVNAARRTLEEILCWSPMRVLQSLRHFSMDTRQQLFQHINWQPRGDEANACYLVLMANYDECVEIGEPAVQPLIDAMENANQGDLNRIINVLGAIGDARAVEPLAERMEQLVVFPDQRDEAIFGTCINIIKSLGKIGGASASIPLTGKITHLNQEVRQTAAEMLFTVFQSSQLENNQKVPIVVALIDALGNGNPGVRQTAAEMLVKMYQSSQFDDEQKKTILAQRPVITSPRIDERTHSQGDHVDIRGVYCGSEHDDYYCHIDTHADEGIGVDFPL